MAIHPILHYPDSRLATIAAPVVRFDNGLKKLVADMFETMYEAKGIGLAATQIDHHFRVVVIDLGEGDSSPLTLINPEILRLGAELEKGREGCLSAPEIYDEVMRAQSLSLKFQDLAGEENTLEAQDLLAVCIQHEIDHLNGLVFVQHLSRLKQARILKKLEKQK